jgi:hypothetical protein
MNRREWLVMALATLATTLATTTSTVSAQPGSAGAPARSLPESFIALAQPQRLVDTRAGQLGVLEQPGGTIGSDVAVRMTPNVPMRLVVGNQGGLPAAPTGMTINATVAAPPAGGFLTLYPCPDLATAAPSTSTLNYRAGLTTGNSAIVSSSAGGVCMVASQPVNVILDVTGYFSNGFTSLASPQRLVDTRAGQTGVLERPGGSIGSDLGTTLQPGVPVRWLVGGQAGLPASPRGIAVNATVISPPAGGFLKIYPCAGGEQPPATSSLNYVANGTTGNSAVVAQAAGGICVVASQAVHVVLDVTGFFTAGIDLLPAPIRLVDSRPGELGLYEQPGNVPGTDINVPLPADLVVQIIVADEAAGPVTGIAINTTVVAPPGGGFVKIYPCSSLTSPQPATSSLNYNAGVTTGNSAIVSLALDSVCAVASQTVNIVVDTTGFVL